MTEHHKEIQSMAAEYLKMHPIVENYENGVLVSVGCNNLHGDGVCDCRMNQNNG